MSIEYFEMVSRMGREYHRARMGSNENDARSIVRHYSEMSGLPESAAEAMIDQFSRQPLY